MVVVMTTSIVRDPYQITMHPTIIVRGGMGDILTIHDLNYDDKMSIMMTK